MPLARILVIEASVSFSPCFLSRLASSALHIFQLVLQESSGPFGPPRIEAYDRDQHGRGRGQPRQFVMQSSKLSRKSMKFTFVVILRTC